MTQNNQPEFVAAEFTGALLDWYRKHKRSLPWRDTSPDAYAVWISEIMLQQTTVAAVGPYYTRWMSAFPTVESLAAADLQDVLRYWAGLGYYARARNLKKAAEQVVERFGARVPDSVDDLMSLPGIGRYTAGAISSIAYGKPEPILDANVIRVLSRLHAIEGDIESATTRAELWRLAAVAIPQEAASDFNQGLMELGALVCTPAAPRCSACPVAGHCDALKNSEPVLYPRSSKTTKWLSVVDCCVAIERGDRRLLFVRRPESGVWGGLWELPRMTAQGDEPLEDCALRAAGVAGVDAAIVGEFGRWKHTVMNRKITLHGFRATASDAACGISSARDGHIWLTAESALGTLPLSSPQRAIVDIWSVAREQPGLAFE